MGLTGGIATGKSHAARVFSRLGAHVVDCDEIAREVVQQGKPAYHEIVKTFGREILREDGEIDRKKLADIIFHDAEARQKLNGIVHPHIFDEEARRVITIKEKYDAGIIVVDAALMIETGIHDRFDKLVVVHCHPKIQLERIMYRDSLSEEEAGSRIQAQLPLDEKVKMAHYTVDTSGTYRETRLQIRKIFQELLKLAQQQDC